MLAHTDIGEKRPVDLSYRRKRWSVEGRQVLWSDNIHLSGVNSRRKRAGWVRSGALGVVVPDLDVPERGVGAVAGQQFLCVPRSTMPPSGS
jgi:hypothetical protein